MKNWNQLFVRHGWLLRETEEDVFDCRFETEINRQFLLQILEKANLSFDFNGKTLVMHSQPIGEEKFISFLDAEGRGRGGDLWFRPGKEDPKVPELDLYICGMVRQLNRLGIYTSGSCDGHGRNSAYVQIVNHEEKVRHLKKILIAIGMKRFSSRNIGSNYVIYLGSQRIQFLDLAEKISMIQEEWLDKDRDEIRELLNEQLFYIQLEELLSIPGVSGNEGRIREAIQEKITPYVDTINIDQCGNLLAEKTYRTGKGPTILLNAHLDTVEEIAQQRQIVKENGIWSSSEGILGADDRAGVAVLLNIAETLHQQAHPFSGKIKYVFTVEEEIGLRGASHVEDDFLHEVDATIVVDRRGTGDIVTSCGGYIPFCDEAYGKFIEEIAEIAGLKGWKCTAGGSSDTRIWAQHGIQSVNLSAGYNHEHTEEEYLDVYACYDTSKLIMTLLRNSRQLQRLVDRLKIVSLK